MRRLISHYCSASGSDPFQHWLNSLQDLRTRVAVLRRVDRMAAGLLGDHHHLRDGVWELRIDLSGGIRVYYGQIDRERVVLLCAGLKRSQARDIDRAVRYWRDYLARTG